MKSRTWAAAAMSAMMLAFVMGARPRAQQMPASSAPTAAAQAAPAGDSDNGRKILVKYGCAQCHGREGQGAPIAGPRIGPSPLPFASFAKYVRAPTGQMPPYTAKVVTDQELADIRAFLASRPRPPAAAQDLLPPE